MSDGAQSVAPAADPTAGRVWRRLRTPLALVATGALTLALVWLNLGRWLEAPAEPPSSADVIVLLGGDSIARLIAGVDLYRQGMAPKVLVAGSDGAGGTRVSNPRLQYLLDAGVPRDAIVVDDLPVNSREEALRTLARMREARWRKALVVSDPPHMRRLSWIWRRAFDGAEVSYVLVSSQARWWRGSEWWRDDWAREFVGNEVVKIGYDIVMR